MYYNTQYTREISSELLMMMKSQTEQVLLAFFLYTLAFFSSTMLPVQFSIIGL
jgi:hypothetical protein